MKHVRVIVITLVSLWSLFTLGACATLQEDGGRDFEPSWPEEADAPKALPGTIYAQGRDVTLWNNVTARNIGDTLTIRLAESTEAEKSATTTASKSSKATLTGPTIAGAPVTVTAVQLAPRSVERNRPSEQAASHSALGPPAGETATDQHRPPRRDVQFSPPSDEDHRPLRVPATTTSPSAGSITRS